MTETTLSWRTRRRRRAQQSDFKSSWSQPADPRFVYVRDVSTFDLGDWVEVDVGILGDGSAEDYVVTDPNEATHRRYRNRVTGQVIVDRIRTL